MKVAIIGGTGYGAVELIRLLHNHPYVTVEAIISHSQSGTDLASVYPHTVDVVDMTMDALDITSLSEKVDLVFFATPSNVSKDLIPSFLENGVKCIDLSGDFRLKEPEAYKKWYQSTPADQEYINQAIYGLSEIYEDEIKNASLIANPGCYPTATLLGLIPALKHNLVSKEQIIIDAKTGVSGAGRGLSLNVHFSEMHENLKAYKLGEHKHIPEIEQVLTNESGQEMQVVFTPHIVPMTRGIMSTMYTNLIIEKSTKEIVEVYQDFYKNHPFVRVRPEGVIPSTKEVYGSNYCDIGIYADQRTGKLMIVSVIDNLVKGASGQAIQNMNLLAGWEATTGLNQIPIYP
ncbi:N-acetyl-gamma-glutamyl-phosphate reductase [Aquibacillus koreensis]|uniref:N-acetyl-gamma-glutamyl-phosphate reductase n=1 Tax=Aquibacillus koreensis TaxID=279446 RepID=A0A9X4AIN5_9BACI|nr:N-acetyl-gamma-glutamyl-phosphate reductase [Aquibacillus koreensis]MCT2538132.1 N-acetyl-gamma-glutamyl-phosphate reductase [Aquibacillus koreensis]MDC3420924.1 N-acetyl-gamma-glutamyl-phosphate reductase [Aquibacillus koreensis]